MCFIFSKKLFLLSLSIVMLCFCVLCSDQTFLITFKKCLKDGHVHVPITAFIYSENRQQIRHSDDVLNLWMKAKSDCHDWWNPLSVSFFFLICDLRENHNLIKKFNTSWQSPYFWIRVGMTNLFSPLNDLKVREVLTFLTKTLFHQLADEAERDQSHRKFWHTGNDIGYPPRALKHHTRCSVQHGVIDGLRRGTDVETTPGWKPETNCWLTSRVPGPPSKTTQTTGMLTLLSAGETVKTGPIKKSSFCEQL